jgi:MYXO-CTERM domain-containing protein
LSAASAQATIWTFNVTIDGAQERPTPVTTTATGLATAIFDDVTGSMNITGTFTGLTSPANNAHLHGYAPLGLPGDPGTTAPPVIDLTFTPATSGTIAGTGTIPAVRIADVLGGLTYINVHSGQFPGGEIRGQLVNPIPEPGTIALAAMGLLGVGYLAVRRRRSAGSR